MFTLITFFFILLTTFVQCQQISVYFPTFPVNTDIGSCTCDLTGNKCDISCCCDLDCSAGDKQTFECSSRDNQYTNSTPVISTVQPTCFKNISIFESNSPYIIQKMGELVCIDYQRYSGSQYYQQPNIQTLDSGAFVRAINTENSVIAPLGFSTGLTNYQVGTPVWIYNTVSGVPNNYVLPTGLLDNQMCSGSQPITYMNDFTSTCSQLVIQSTCSGALNPSTYINSLCLLQSPSNSSGYVCDNTTTTATSFTLNTCFNALESLTITIFYSNPAGIVNVSVSYSTANASNSTSFQQTFTVQFIQNGTSPSDTTKNPGYLQGANIMTSTANGSLIQSESSSQFSVLKPISGGFCGGTGDRTVIRFGVNIRSTCKYNVTSTTICPNLYSLLMPTNSTNLYVAAYSNSNPLNISNDWLPVISCTSQIGSSDTDGCQIGVLNSSTNSLCYVKLDIQIAYTNIGSINNPQPVLSAVIFNYQGLALSTLLSNTTTTILVSESVTFQDISATPVVIQGQIPAPNTRLPANFFYPFSASQATKSKTFSPFFYVLISILFMLM